MKTEKLLKYTFIKELLYYDGPIISLGITNNKEPVLEIWCDTNHQENYNLYAYAFIQKEDFQPFVDAKKSYYNVLKDAQEIIIFKYNGEAFDFSIMSNEDFISNYGPKPTADMNNDLIDFREALAEFTSQKNVELY